MWQEGWIIDENMKKNSSTQDIINIDRIENDTVVLKSGGLRKVLLVSGISFELKSEDEKNLILFSYQDFLNSLDFSIQQVVHSRKLNIGKYLEVVGQTQKREENKLLQQLITDYRQFISEFVSKNPIMTKTFFLVVPYDPVTVPKLKVFKKKKKLASEPSIAKDLRQLSLRVDEVIGGLNRLGIRAIPLAKDELMELFYNFYNPKHA